MRRFLWLAFLLVALLVACGGNEGDEGETAVAQPSDPTLIANTGKPQLIEFYADW